jgi:hypothetical protein
MCLIINLKIFKNMSNEKINEYINNPAIPTLHTIRALTTAIGHNIEAILSAYEVLNKLQNSLELSLNTKFQNLVVSENGPTTLGATIEKAEEQPQTVKRTRKTKIQTENIETQLDAPLVPNEVKSVQSVKTEENKIYVPEIKKDVLDEEDEVSETDTGIVINHDFIQSFCQSKIASGVSRANLKAVITNMGFDSILSVPLEKLSELHKELMKVKN